MEIGVFIPIGNNGWLISSTSPQYTPSFDLNREIVLRAERYGFDFALSMIKLRGFGGKSRHWDDNLESFTLMAGLASITTRIELYATVAVLTMPPPLTARMAMTIDSISNGRFGVNLVTGWQKAEYDQMGLWPGDDHYKHRYELLTEYATVIDRKSTRLTSHTVISYAVFCLKKKKKKSNEKILKKKKKKKKINITNQIKYK